MQAPTKPKRQAGRCHDGRFPLAVGKGLASPLDFAADIDGTKFSEAQNLHLHPHCSCNSRQYLVSGELYQPTSKCTQIWLRQSVLFMLNESDNPSVGFYICARSTKEEKQKLLHLYKSWVLKYLILLKMGQLDVSISGNSLSVQHEQLLCIMTFSCCHLHQTGQGCQQQIQCGFSQQRAVVEQQML